MKVLEKNRAIELRRQGKTFGEILREISVFTNSDPGMIRLMMRWFRLICRVPNTKFRIRIQCHGADRVGECQEYWSRIVNIPLTQFTKPYIRISPTSKKKTGNLCPYGICNIRISDVFLLTRIKAWIKGLTALSSSLV